MMYTERYAGLGATPMTMVPSEFAARREGLEIAEEMGRVADPFQRIGEMVVSQMFLPGVPIRSKELQIASRATAATFTLGLSEVYGKFFGGMGREVKKLKEKPFETLPTVVRETGPIAYGGAQTSDIVKKYSDVVTGGGLLQEEAKFKYAMAAEKLDELESNIKSQERYIESKMNQIEGMKQGYWDTANLAHAVSAYLVPQYQATIARYDEISGQVQRGPQAIEAVGAKTGLKEGAQTIYSPRLQHGSITIETPKKSSTQPITTQLQPVGQVRAVYGGLAGLDQMDWSPTAQYTVIAGLIIGSILLTFWGDR